MKNTPLKYLALGDSYTIGESVPPKLNFPNQLYRMANDEGIQMESPRIIAKTGWTTDELIKGINEANEILPVSKDYDLVSLLIGVNNQYRGRSVQEFKNEFSGLVEKGLEFAVGKTENMVILSIPDWGVTPFASDRNRQQIAMEIDAFNEAVEQVAKSRQIHYIYVTKWSRQADTIPGLLAEDGLHPSGIEYERWSREILQVLKKI